MSGERCGNEEKRFMMDGWMVKELLLVEGWMDAERVIDGWMDGWMDDKN